jgi:hypothetical protein
MDINDEFLNYVIIFAILWAIYFFTPVSQLNIYLK